VGCIARAWVPFLAAPVIQVGRGPVAHKASGGVEGSVICICVNVRSSVPCHVLLSSVRMSTSAKFCQVTKFCQILPGCQSSANFCQVIRFCQVAEILPNSVRLPKLCQILSGCQNPATFCQVAEILPTSIRLPNSAEFCQVSLCL